MTNISFIEVTDEQADELGDLAREACKAFDIQQPNHLIRFHDLVKIDGQTFVVSRPARWFGGYDSVVRVDDDGEMTPVYAPRAVVDHYGTQRSEDEYRSLVVEESMTIDGHAVEGGPTLSGDALLRSTL